MGNMLNMKRKLKSRTGSATVMALIFMLFLSIAGGAWVMMLASESGTASSDNAEQMAWYAAEAGIKRAKAEIEANNDDWSWTTDEKAIPDGAGNTWNAVSTGLFSDDSKLSRYGVYIDYTIDEGEAVKISQGMPKAGTADITVTYHISSVGRYGDMRKVIQDNLKVVIAGKSIPELDAIRDYQKSQTGYHADQQGTKEDQNIYLTAYQDALQNGAYTQLTRERLQEIVGADIKLPSSFPGGSDTLYWVSAGAVLLDGSVADIQMLAPRIGITGNGLSDIEKYRAAGFAVEGETYLYTDNGVLTARYQFGNKGGAVTPIDKTTGKTVKLANVINVMEAFSNRSAWNIWDSAEDQITWFKSELDRCGYVKQ